MNLLMQVKIEFNIVRLGHVSDRYACKVNRWLCTNYEHPDPVSHVTEGFRFMKCLY